MNVLRSLCLHLALVCLTVATATAESASGRIRMTAANWGDGIAYFFRGQEYIRFDLRAGRALAGYPKRIDSRAWLNLPAGTIDAGLDAGNGKAYLFTGSQYVRFDIAADRLDAGYPKPIDAVSWPGVPWTDRIDAAVAWGNGKIVLFRGGEYVRFDIASDHADPGYPKAIDAVTWPGLPWTTGIDAAVNAGNGKAYLFKDGQYVRFDIAADRVEAGYPKPVDETTWPGLWKP